MIPVRRASLPSNSVFKRIAPEIILGKMQRERRHCNYLWSETGGKLTTRKSISAKEIIKKQCKDFGGSLNDHDTATLACISRNTYYKYKAELRAELD